jgi:hypothetical protein
MQQKAKEMQEEYDRKAQEVLAKLAQLQRRNQELNFQCTVEAPAPLAHVKLDRASVMSAATPSRQRYAKPPEGMTSEVLRSTEHSRRDKHMSSLQTRYERSFLPSVTTARKPMSVPAVDGDLNSRRRWFGEQRQFLMEDLNGRTVSA